MAADPTKKRIVLIVHGVQIGSNKDLTQDVDIQKLIDRRLGGTHLDYGVDLYAYEDINDKAYAPLIQLSKLMLKTPAEAVLVDVGIELIGDVVISLSKNSAADAIRTGLREKILQYYASGNPLYILAHSLGSIYAFDVINDLMTNHTYFNRNDRSTWPVQGLMTIGSPIGLAMFKKTGRNNVVDLGPGARFFHWLNYYDVNDPVVSGDLFGKKISTNKIAENYKSGKPEQGWYIQDFKVDTGKLWVAAHTSYWKTAAIGDGLVGMMI